MTLYYILSHPESERIVRLVYPQTKCRKGKILREEKWDLK